MEILIVKSLKIYVNQKTKLSIETFEKKKEYKAKNKLSV